MKRKLLLYIGITIPAIAFSKPFDSTISLINNSNQSMIFTFKDNTTKITATSCDNNAKQISNNSYKIDPNSLCKLNIENKKHSKLSLDYENKGKIIISRTNNIQNYCNIDYSYKQIQNSIFADKIDVYSENFSMPNCYNDESNYLSNMISVKTPKTEERIRPIGGDKLSNLIKKYNAIYSIVSADCYGSMNCIIVSPDLNTKYIDDNSSSLKDSLSLQANIDSYESLNIAQFIGVHNSIISKHYTSSKNPLNISIADPDNYSSVTEMLNSGIRMIELDAGYIASQIRICHNHADDSLSKIACDNNYPLSTALQEINNWIATNPNNLIMLYLDGNTKLNEHIPELDYLLEMSDNYILKPSLAQKYGLSQSSILDLSKVTKNNIVYNLHKNIILIVTQNLDNFAQSKYIFTGITNSTQHPLYTMSIEKFLNKSISGYPDKYSQISKIFSADLMHSNWIRLNTARTAVDYYANAGDSNPYEYRDYLTTENIPELLKYPINVFALSMVGYACNSSECTQIKTDPRLYNLLWSWGLGYPRKNGSNYAYINTQTNHFENDINKNIDYALCSITFNSQTLKKSWLIVDAKNLNYNNLNDICRKNGGKFATPTTSYWMDDVLSLAKQNNINGNIAVNYYKQDSNTWIAN